MAVDVIMPQMGESIFEGTITKWLKKPGDKIERDEPLFEISTDKVDAEIPSPAAGVLQEIKVGEGQTVPIQTVVATISADGAAAAAPAPALPQRPKRPRPKLRKPAPAAPAPKPAPASAPAPQCERRLAAAPSPAPTPRRPSSPIGRKASQFAAWFAGSRGNKGIDLSQVPGTGAWRPHQQKRYSGFFGIRQRSRRSRSHCSGPRSRAALPRRLRRCRRPRQARPMPRSKQPCRASACISAITKCSPCP